eukprot:CAMPEP_0167753222 /NCGR_PEP_ID=MMETSP0110_2-20121227/7587_1 /TAXON_ID=629695 /ORGANISM="Gymnochlora sp., Strain CCMP2014" /LENGTH=493 /DNA_ID=CAMNT_0007638951 /DNA_START=29 /DNA_END=1507 /DNA_ORIENTATION=-
MAESKTGSYKLNEVEQCFRNLQNLSKEGKMDAKRINGAILQLRRAVLFEGINEPVKLKLPVKTTFRGQIWKICAGVMYQDMKDPIGEYIKLLKKGPNRSVSTDNTGSNIYKRLREDSYRVAEHQDKKGMEDRTVRILNCFTYSYPSIGYKQGLMFMLRCLLTCMNEVDAYYTFCHLMKKEVKTYYLGRFTGAFAACRLVDMILVKCDPELHKAIKKISFKSQIFHLTYTLKLVQPFMSQKKPVIEVVKLWDVFFTLGFPFMVLAVAALYMLIRHKLMKCTRMQQYSNLLGDEALNELSKHFYSRSITGIMTLNLQIIGKDRKLMKAIKEHTSDLALCERLKDWNNLHPFTPKESTLKTAASKEEDAFSALDSKVGKNTDPFGGLGDDDFFSSQPDVPIKKGNESKNDGNMGQEEDGFGDMELPDGKNFFFDSSPTVPAPSTSKIKPANVEQEEEDGFDDMELPDGNDSFFNSSPTVPASSTNKAKSTNIEEEE